MSIKELLEKIFGGIAKLFTAKNGVRNLIILIIGFLIVIAIINYVDDRKKCARFLEANKENNLSCELGKEFYGDQWDESYGDGISFWRSWPYD